MLGSLSVSFFDSDKTTIAILDGSEFDVSFLVGETHSWEIQTTQNPVEEGADVTDHIQPMPRQVTISGRESTANLNLFQLAFGDSGDRIENAKAFFTELYESRKIVTLTTRLHSYPRMIATNIEQSSNAGDGESMPWSVSFKEIEIAASGGLSLGGTLTAAKKPAITATAAASKKVSKMLSVLGVG